MSVEDREEEIRKYNAQQAKKGLERLLSNEKALEVIAENVFKLAQSEDGDMWAKPYQTATITGLIAFAVFNNLDDMIETEEMLGFYDAHGGECGTVVVGKETDDGIEFEDALSNNYYITIFNT